MLQTAQRPSSHHGALLSGLQWGVVCTLVGLVLFLRQADARPPNIILILADDLGWGDLRSYGHPHARTPHLDRMAQEGTLFTAYYTASGVCSPTRTALMTGQFPSRLGIHTIFRTPPENQAYGVPDYLDPALPTITRLLKDVGYATGHFGKWHLGSAVHAPGPDAYGIDDHRTTDSPSHAPKLGGGATKLNGRSQLTARVFDEAIRFVTMHSDQPFYLQVWTQLPHAPLHPSPEQLALYAHLTPHPALPYRSPEQIYLASITDIDTQVGRLLTTLTDLGLVQDTLVVFTSDNGPADLALRVPSYSGVGSPGPFRGRKHSLYEGGIRVPFLVRWPGHVPTGRVSHAVIAAVDWLPTIASIVGATGPFEAASDGENVADIWFGTDRPRQKPLLWEWRFTIPGHVLNRSPIAAIREGQWKLLLNPDGSRVELYDIPTDPGEVNNLATQQMGVVFSLALKLLTWQASLPPGPVSPQAGQNTYPWPGQMP
jgi:N-acetylgalactosamine-6-sulfatase